MIKIVAKNYVKPECVQAFKDTAKELIEKSRAEEGKSHNKSEHFTGIVPKLGQLCAREGEVELFVEI